MFIDDLPMWGYVGEVCFAFYFVEQKNHFQKIKNHWNICYFIPSYQVVHEEFLLGKTIQGARVYLYPHLHFSIGFNNDQIVAVNVTTDAKRQIDITEAHDGQEVSP